MLCVSSSVDFYLVCIKEEGLCNNLPRNEREIHFTDVGFEDVDKIVDISRKNQNKSKSN